MTASLICSKCSLSRWPIINKTTMQLRRLFKVQWPINKLITKRAMAVITKCNRLFHYRVQWQVIRPAILFLSEMTCYYKVYLYKVRWPVIAKLDSYFTTKFNILVQIGQFKLDIQIILQSWPKGFRRHFLFVVSKIYIRF